VKPPAHILKVAVPAPLMALFDYLPPAGASALQPGQRVRVPFGNSARVGLIMATASASSLPANRLRRATSVLDEQPLLPADVLRLLAWSSRYYQHPPGEVFAAAVPKALREGGDPGGESRWLATAAGVAVAIGELRRAPAQQQLLAAIQRSDGGLSATELADVGGNGWRRAARALEARGWISVDRVPALLPMPVTVPDSPPMLLPDQQVAVSAVTGARAFTAFLLDGVTGSGKTEVYMRAIEPVLRAGRQALVLVPEIGLTPQLLHRFRSRFPVPIAELHSGLADGLRLAGWSAARDGTASIIVGTRSAVFTPLARPGLVIVDEEHDASFKQQEGFRYSARDLAVWRARELGVPLVLGSATPSLESIENARAGRYQRLSLPARAAARRQPSIHVIDLRRHQPTEGLATPLVAAIRRHLDAGGQALVYLNRRGYAPTLLCPGCGLIVHCERCDARMVLHRRQSRVTCHHCGAERRAPSTCPDCGRELLAVGQGTERLEEALAAAFPGEEIVRIDRDTTRRRGEIGRRLERVHSAEARLLMGTQMLTKGHDFPQVTLVAIVDADQGLFGTDFRSAERLAQAFIQVAGRAGRADRPGEVYLQTLFPDHPLLKLLIASGYASFADAALDERRLAGWPPYTCLALLRAEAAQRPPVMAFLSHAAAAGHERAAAGVRLLGPAPAPMERRAGRFRGQLLVHAPSRRALLSFLPGWRAAIDDLPSQRRVRWNLDVDPNELF
jgi:primosomal protein N' (replication factor Y)